ncbi:hypothetical protein BaRGS_00001791, partial [Batillaria attramentaria]
MTPESPSEQGAKGTTNKHPSGYHIAYFTRSGCPYTKRRRAAARVPGQTKRKIRLGRGSALNERSTVAGDLAGVWSQVLLWRGR